MFIFKIVTANPLISNQKISLIDFMEVDLSIHLLYYVASSYASSVVILDEY